MRKKEGGAWSGGARRRKCGGESERGKVTQGRDPFGPAPFVSVRLMAATCHGALHGPNEYTIWAIGEPQAHRRSIGLAGGYPLATYPIPSLRILKNLYSLRFLI